MRKPPRPPRPESRRPTLAGGDAPALLPEGPQLGDGPVRVVPTSLLALAEMHHAASTQARSGPTDEPLARAGRGLGWEEPAGAPLPRPRAAWIGDGERQAPTARVAPVAVAGSRWLPQPTLERVSSSRQMVMLGGAAALFLVSVAAVVAVVVASPGEETAATQESAARAVAGEEGAGRADGVAVDPVVPLGGVAGAGDPSVAGAKDVAVRTPDPPPRAVEERRPQSADATQVPEPKPAVSEPVVPKPATPKPLPAAVAPKGMRFVTFSTTGEWGGGQLNVSCGARHHVDKALGSSAVRVELLPETCPASVKCSDGGARVAMNLRTSAVAVSCTGCTATSPVPECHVR